MTDITLVELDSVDSTQDEVRDRLTSIAAGDIVAVSARSQRVGRGREGRTWQDPPGAALMLSVGRRGPLPTSVLEDLPRRVADALLALVGDGLHWKAPNDVVDEHGAKVAGILVDARTVGDAVEHVVVGIGINLDGATFTTDDGRPATSIGAATGRSPSFVALRDALVSRLALTLDS